MYKLYVHDRDYKEWKIFNSVTLEQTEKDMDPIKCKLFNQDIFSLEHM